MTPFSKFKFAQGLTRRHKLLSDVMPVSADFEYFVVLSDAYLTLGGSERHICNFVDLQEALGHDVDLQELQLTRVNGQLTEGRHELPSAVASYLAEAGRGAAHVRRWVFGVSEPIITTLPLSVVKDGWSRSDFEEIEIGDSHGRWYFRTRDDDPLVFLAVSTGALSEQIKQCKEFYREVGRGFEYAM